MVQHIFLSGEVVAVINSIGGRLFGEGLAGIWIYSSVSF